MERRTAFAAAVAGAATLATAAVTLAAVGAIDILGFRSPSASAGAAAPVVVKQIETVDNVVVVPSTGPVATGTTITISAAYGAQNLGGIVAALMGAPETTG
ncbi:MAG: hypothetical protein RLZZ623_2642, partial [Actinomycetota bacterium]